MDVRGCWWARSSNKNGSICLNHSELDIIGICLEKESSGNMVQ